MKHLIRAFSATLLIMHLISCGPSEREMAVKYINTAKAQIIQGDTLRAIEKLDSVRILYPNAEVQIGVARNINNELFRQLINNRKNELYKTDSLMIELEKSFTQEKTEFDQYTQYVHKRQTFNRSWDRSFIQVHLDERGEIYLSSNYMGEEWLDHTGIRVYDGKLQAKSEKVPLDSPLNHRSDFLDYKWEKVSYMNGKADSVIQFIATHPELDLKCVFLGKRYYYILLESYDIDAISKAYALSNAIKRKNELQMTIDLYTSKIK